MNGKTIATNLKIARIKARLKVEEVAKAMELTKATIYNYEKDASNVELNKLFRLAEIYKCNVRDFLNTI